MPGKTVLAVLAAALTVVFSSCTVMQSTYRKKADEADTLAKRYAELQMKHDGLSAENAAMSAEIAGLKDRQGRLTTDLAYVTGQRDKLSKDKEELNAILKSRSDALSQNIYELRGKVEDLERENARLVKAREEQVRKVSSTYEDLLEKMKTEIAQGQVTISELKGKLSVNMVDSILFDSGRAEVKKGGEDVLAKVVSSLKEVKDKSIRIEGHTDNVQISAALAKRYPTNWELSAARAINVTRFLQQRGIDPGQLSAVGYGEWKPVGDNATPEGRARNRRIEITLVERDER